MIKEFYLIVGRELEELLKEIADFSIIFYNVTVDILLCKNGRHTKQLEEDLRILIRKYLMYIEKSE